MTSINKTNIHQHMPYIYELNHGDALIIHAEDANTYIIIEGIMFLQKQFTNREIITTHILHSGNIIQTEFNPSYKKNYFYKIEAVSKAYISSFSNKYKQFFFQQVFEYQNKDDLYNSYNTTEILIHKNMKHRFIHALMLLSELFGKSHYHKIIIKLQISHTMFASLIGCNTNTISKIIKSLEKLKMISYSRDHIVIESLALLSTSRQAK